MWQMVTTYEFDKKGKKMETKHNVITYSKNRIQVIKCEYMICGEKIYKKLSNMFHTFQN